MKKILGLTVAVLFGLTTINAMSYEEARDRARFLTDKMAYELNLNDAQYNDAYEINLDYLMNINTASDACGIYWEYRNADLRYILYDWQYTLFTAASHFFRPVIWGASGWFFPVFNIYPVTRFYYDPPKVYHVYRGGHYNYRFSHPASFYADRRPVWDRGFRGEHRGPVTGRNTTLRQDHNGFRFEQTDKRPRQNAGNKTDNGRGSSSTGRNTIRNNTNVTTSNRTPVRTEGRTTVSRTQDSRDKNSTRGTSNYNRPSSTRTTVNQKQNTTVRTNRTQNTTTVQRGTTRSTTGNNVKTSQRTSGPSRSGR